MSVSPKLHQSGFCFSPNDSRLTVKKLRVDEVNSNFKTPNPPVLTDGFQTN
jgi:hypothetical protein